MTEQYRIGSLEEALAYIRVFLEEPGGQSKSVPVVNGPLDLLCRIFHFGSFERDLLLLCLAVELDPEAQALCARVANDQSRPFVTLHLAAGILPNPDYSVIQPDSLLRRFMLLGVDNGLRPLHNPLYLPERMVHFLIGQDSLAEKLLDMVEPVFVNEEPSSRQLDQAKELVDILGPNPQPRPHVQIYGGTAAERRKVAGLACHMLNRSLFAIAGAELPSESLHLREMLRCWRREAVLSGRILYVETEDQLDHSAPNDRRVLEILGSFDGGPLIVGGRGRLRVGAGPCVHMQLSASSYAEQRQFWQTALGNRAEGMKDVIDTLVSQFKLPETEITAACATLPDENLSKELAQQRLWRYCRTQLQPALDALAHRIEPSAQLDDLVLPDRQKNLLEEIAAQVRHRVRVYEDWDFRKKSGRDLGISVLFHGPSGTGKTMAAEVLAGRLGLNLYRIDLSTVISKYIGETEKNLSRIFDAAEAGGAILLFDEADAIFGKRSEVKSSHDRHANIEVSYLLQRIEAFHGLAILTTNLKEALDDAFLRRLRFFIGFPFPNETQRAEIWKRIFPTRTPVDDLDYTRLARMKLAGGNIRNIAVNAAFRAANDGSAIKMNHLISAAEREYEKMGRHLVELDD